MTALPVDDWASWAAGSGIRIHAYLQSWAQAVRRWGPDGAESLWSACKAKIVFTSVMEDALMEKISRLAGKVRLWDDHAEQFDERYGGRRGPQRRRVDIDVLPAAQVRMIPNRCAVVIAGNAKPTIIRLTNIRDRRDYKKWRKGSRSVPLQFQEPREIAQVRPELADPQHRRLLAQQRELAQRQIPVPPDEIAARRARRGLPEGEPDGRPGQPGVWPGRSAGVPPLPLPGRPEAPAPLTGEPCSYGPPEPPYRPADPYSPPALEPPGLGEPDQVGETGSWVDDEIALPEREPWDPWNSTGTGE